MKKLSIRGQLIVYSISISLIVSGIAFFVLRFNAESLENNSKYLTYISKINILYQLQEENEKLLYQMIEVPKEETEQEIEQNIETSYQLLTELEENFSTRNSKLRIRAANYLLKRFQNHVQETIWLKDYEGDGTQTVNTQSAYYTMYLETIDISGRIDSYLQEILRYSVDENQEFIQDSTKNNEMLQGLLLGFILLLLVVSISFYFVFANYVSKLIQNITSITQRIAKGGRQQNIISLEGPKEMQELTVRFNELLDTIYALNEEAEEKARLKLQQVKMRERLKESQLHGLQMQIQPHFLFNTLNIISMMAMLENADKAYELILALSKLMRFYLKKGNQTVYIEEELDMIGQYLYILKARMGEQLTYEIRIKANTKRMKIPLFTLQPIVENAFKHGLENFIHKGFILIRTKERKDFYFISVYNNGIAMTKEQLKAVRKKVTNPELSTVETKIGLENAAYRLYGMFGEGIRFCIHSSEQRGTIFTIQIQVLPNEPEK